MRKDRLTLITEGRSVFAVGAPRATHQVQSGRDVSGTFRKAVNSQEPMLDPAPEDSPFIGRKLGRFRVVSKLGVGGFATVWKAHDELLGRTVALKILDESLAANAKTRRRFVHDAQAASMLDHPHVVTIYDAGESDGHAYIALTFVDGDTISDLAAHRLMPIEEVVRIAIAAAQGLEHAHGRGVIHRDVTGRNIMVARDGRVFVLDFGLAFAPGMSRLTSSDTTLGTAAYMCPEAFSGGPIDARSDVYGLGVVMFEALTGAFPFTGERPEIVAFAKLNHEPRRPRDLRPDVPPELERIVLRALARQRSRRYPRVGVMLQDLRVLAEGLRVPGGTAVVSSGSPASATVERGGSSPVEPSRAHGSDASARVGPTYLAISPFLVLGRGDDPEGVQVTLARRLPEVLGAALGGEVHVVPVRDAEAMEDPGPAMAQRLGANTLLAGTVGRTGTRVRVTFSVRDLWRGAQQTGDIVDGSALQLFDLEDAVVASVRKALGLRGPTPGWEPARALPADPAAEDHYRLAVSHLERHDDEASLDAAIRLLEGLEASDPGQSTYPATLARVFLRKQVLTGSRVWETKAAMACERARQLDPRSFETRLALAELASASGHANEAVVAFGELAAQESGSAEPWLGMARALFALGKYDDAERACSEAIRRRSDDWRGHGRLGFVRYGRGNFMGALEAWRTAVELVPESIRARMNLGGVLYRLGRLDDALEQFALVLKRRPNAEAYWNVGTILYYLGRDPEAIDALERSVALAPERVLSWGNLGNACRQVPGKEARAREALERAVALAEEELERNGSAAELRARLAGWLTGLGEHGRARREIEQALRDAPEDVRVLETAGHVYLLLGDRVAAVGWLKAAVGKGYAVEELRRSRELAVLRADPEFRALLEE